MSIKHENRHATRLKRWHQSLGSVEGARPAMQVHALTVSYMTPSGRQTQTLLFDAKLASVEFEVELSEELYESCSSCRGKNEATWAAAEAEGTLS